MRINRLWAGAACGVALGAGGLLAADLATDTADAQSGVTLSAAQLGINQKISQAAVRRSNMSLNYLRPIRTGQLDTANNRGVQNPQGNGWATAQIANNAITSTKLSTGVRSQLNTIYTAAVFASGADPNALALVRGNGADGVTRTQGLGAGAFDVTFESNITACTWTASVSTPTGSALTPIFAPYVVWPTLLGTSQLRVFVFNVSTGALQDAPFTAQVVC